MKDINQTIPHSVVCCMYIKKIKSRLDRGINNNLNQGKKLNNMHQMLYHPKPYDLPGQLLINCKHGIEF